MAVALNNLIGNQRRLESGLAADVRLDFGRDLREGAHGAGNLPDADIVDGFLKTREMARHFLIPERQLQSEGDRLGVHAVRAADHHGPFIFARLAAQHVHEVFDVLFDQRRSFFELHRQRRVHHVRRGHADMEIARIVADRFCDRAQKRDDLVLDLGFDRADALHIEARFPANARDRRLWELCRGAPNPRRRGFRPRAIFENHFLPTRSGPSQAGYNAGSCCDSPYSGQVQGARLIALPLTTFYPCVRTRRLVLPTARAHRLRATGRERRAARSFVRCAGRAE